MKTIKIGGHKVTIYDSIDELPIKRFHIYNKYMLIDSGVGSDINDVNGRIYNAIRFIKNDKKEMAIREIENMRQGLFLISEGINPKHLAFTALIYDINGQKITDISDSNLRKIHDKISNENVKLFDKLIASLKKKIDDELDIYFKDMFSDSRTKEYYNLLKKKIMLQLNAITKDVNNDDEVLNVLDKMLIMYPPKKFGGSSDSAEVRYEKEFEDMCIMISDNLKVEPKEMTVLSFYNSFEFLKKKLKSNTETIRKSKNGR